MSTHLDSPARQSPAAANHWRRSASQAIHPSAIAPDVSLVEAIAAGLAAVVVPWELDGRSTDQPSNELVLSTDVYDAWIIHWPPGQADEPHDHRGSAGAFAVVSGGLVEVRLGGDGSIVTTSLGPGTTRAFDDTTRHLVRNDGAVTATSVHVYSPPLRTGSPLAAHPSPPANATEETS